MENGAESQGNKSSMKMVLGMKMLLSSQSPVEAGDTHTFSEDRRTYQDALASISPLSKAQAFKSVLISTHSFYQNTQITTKLQMLFME